MVYYTSPDGFIVALDARTGEMRWETKTTGGMTAGAIVVEGKVITGRTCAPRRENCYIAAHDAKTGAEAWRFYTAAGSNEPGGETWGGAPEATRGGVHLGPAWRLRSGSASGLLGCCQPYAQHTRRSAWRKLRRDPASSPADLYSNSTMALNIDTGKLAWYYQHLPGDDWDEDYPHERTLLSHGREPGSQVRQVDQSRCSSRRDSATWR